MKSRVGVIISACLFAGFAYAQQDDYEAFKREQAQKFGMFATNQDRKSTRLNSSHA